jgi:hypothetical protein
MKMQTRKSNGNLHFVGRVFWCFAAEENCGAKSSRLFIIESRGAQKGRFWHTRKSSAPGKSIAPFKCLLPPFLPLLYVCLLLCSLYFDDFV